MKDTATGPGSPDLSDLSRAALDALTAHVAVLHPDGTVLAVNEAWRRFAAENGLAVPGDGVGWNYFSVCADAGGSDARQAREIRSGILSVARGEDTEYVRIYACHAPEEKRWFQLRATRFLGPGGSRVMVAHENVSTVKEAEERLQEVSQRILEAQESERGRIARDLHDGVMQILSSIKFRLQASRACRRNGEAAPEVLGLLEHAMQEVRRISRGLRPPHLEDLGLAIALHQQCEEVRRRGGLQVVEEIDDAVERAHPDVELALFRIAQEALTNVERHAAARRVHVRLARREGDLLLEVADDGRGFAGVLSGVGLSGMRQRAALLHARLGVDSAPGTGTTIQVIVPADSTR